jgi:hypothetical protein
MFRRTFLISGLMLLGFGRRAWARFTGVTNCLPLTRPVRIPLDQVAQAWRPAPFVAEGVSPTTAARPGRRVLLSGVLFQRATGDDHPGLSALCLTCPHEQCPVRLVTDPTQLARITGCTGQSSPKFPGSSSVLVTQGWTTPSWHRQVGARRTNPATTSVTLVCT